MTTHTVASPARKTRVPKTTDNGVLEPQTVGELIRRLGDISPDRILMNPPPGKAKEKDLIQLLDHSDRLAELIDGTLVEKVMGLQESKLTVWLGYLLQSYLEENDLGDLSGADGAIKILPSQVRIPDLAFTTWESSRLSEGAAIGRIAPELAIEVISQGNTPAEMLRKRREYFQGGTREVWLVYPEQRNVEVWRSPEEGRTLKEGEVLDGGDILPGLNLPVARIFEKLTTPPAAKRAPRKRKGKGS